MIEFAVQCYLDILAVSLPVAIVFSFCNLIVTTFLNSAFGGKLWFGKK